jgi:hypothetical protein
MNKNIYWPSCKVHVFCQILIKLELLREIFEKYSYAKFHENPSSGSQGVPGGQRDGANGSFS